jgi:hypothetical protein
MPPSILPHPYTRRLQRLLTIINEIKTNPHQTPETLYTSLGISSAMFYKDCQVLKALGFAFRYDRQQRRHSITHDRFLPVLDLSTTELLALIMAVRQIASTGDYTLTYEAIAALRKVVSNTPVEVRAFLQASLDDIVLQEGFGCNATILHDLWRACQEHHRPLSNLLQTPGPVPRCLHCPRAADQNVSRQSYPACHPPWGVRLHTPGALQLSRAPSPQF